MVFMFWATFSWADGAWGYYIFEPYLVWMILIGLFIEYLAVRLITNYKEEKILLKILKSINLTIAMNLISFMAGIILIFLPLYECDFLMLVLTIFIEAKVIQKSGYILNRWAWLYLIVANILSAGIIPAYGAFFSYRHYRWIFFHFGPSVMPLIPFYSSNIAFWGLIILIAFLLAVVIVNKMIINRNSESRR